MTQIILPLAIGTLIVHQRAADWHACIKDEPDVCGCGSSHSEAVGDLLRSHPERFAVMAGKRIREERAS